MTINELSPPYQHSTGVCFATFDSINGYLSDLKRKTNKKTPLKVNKEGLTDFGIFAAVSFQFQDCNRKK